MRLKSTALAIALFLVLAASASARPLPLHEWGMPSGVPKGVVITIHGGGWVTTGAAVMRQQPTARYRQQGWATLNIDYRPGRDSILDVVRFYDLARHTAGPRAPICAAGQSAGGNLAMMLAVYRPRLACVISQEGPAVVTPLLQGYTVPDLYATVLANFSPSDALRMSPALHLDGWRGRMLATYSLADTIVPGAVQRDALGKIRADVDVMRIHGVEALTPAGLRAPIAPRGMGEYPHLNGASKKDISRFYARERILLREVATRT